MKISGEHLLHFLTSQNSLLDSKLTSIGVVERDNEVAIDLTFTSRKDADYCQIKLSFDAVREFLFSHSNDYVFGNVETVKFTKTSDMYYYFSIDPDPSTKEPSNDDGDFIKALRISAIIS